MARAITLQHADGMAVWGFSASLRTEGTSEITPPYVSPLLKSTTLRHYHKIFSASFIDDVDDYSFDECDDDGRCGYCIQLVLTSDSQLFRT